MWNTCALLVAVLAQAAGQTWTGTLTSEGWSGGTCAGTPAYSSTVESVVAMSDGCACLSGTYSNANTWNQRQCHSCDGATTTSVAWTTDCNAGCSVCDGVSGTSTYGNGVDFADSFTGSDCVGFTIVVDGDTAQSRSEQYGALSSDEATEFIAALNGCSPSSPPASDPCFPSSSSVSLADGTTKRLDALKEGDEIVAATAEGALTTDTVSLLSIANPEKSVATYLSLVTAANATLTLTAGHHLPVGASCCTTLKLAKDVQVGETVWVAAPGAPHPTTITAKTWARATGLHSPVLTHGSFPVVDGLVTSFDSIEKVRLAEFGLAPLLAACKTAGTCDKFKEMFLHEALQYIA